MERTHQIINAEGLQIPLPFMQKYGLQPGASVVIELNEDAIRIVPRYLEKVDIENRALRLLLHNLGDAVTVKAERQEAVNGGDPHAVNGWLVQVSARGLTVPLGYLRYSDTGELISELPTALNEMRQKAVELAALA